MKEYKDYRFAAIPENVHPLVSVCVAVYNSEAYLPRSIDSILVQTYDNLEIILVDDGSTDHSGDICDEYARKDSRIKVYHKPNGGLYTTRNAGIEAATGDYICFLDGDDYIDKDMYEHMLSVLISEDAELCAVRYRLIFENNSVSDKSTDKVIVYDSQEMLKQFLIEDEAVLIQNSAWNKLYKRSLINDLRFPDRWYEDMLYTPKLLSRPARSVYIDRAHHNYICDRSASIMNMGINPRIFTDLIPNLYDRSAYLEAIGRHDLALISDYHLYKKLLGFVDQIYTGSDPDRKSHLRTLDNYIRSGKGRFDEIYSIDCAKPNDRKKMKLYIASPLLYETTMILNRNIRLPLRLNSK
ncbi:MAG: glycosyltransferase [Lachnospiraceae bacterium]|nr:glycosyltransferase [Lachnospiraceae bacterium]